MLGPPWCLNFWQDLPNIHTAGGMLPLAQQLHAQISLKSQLLKSGIERTANPKTKSGTPGDADALGMSARPRLP